jgi:RNA polymerase sigma factor (sigma-70 family)
MPVTNELLRRARRLKPAAAADLLQTYYPSVCRMARGLCGQERLARRVVSSVMSRSLRAMRKWREESAPDRWFYHHTVLACRDNAVRLSELTDDLLISANNAADAAYLAFVRALRSLPHQQREAILLHHGERLSARQLGIAMDCSVQAAAAHLRQASDTLQTVAGNDCAALMTRLSAAHAALTPPIDAVRQAVAGHMRRYFWPRRVLKSLRAVAVVLAVIAAAWYVWHRYITH